MGDASPSRRSGAIPAVSIPKEDGDYIKRLSDVAREHGLEPGRDIPVRVISGHMGAETAETMSAAWGGAAIFDWYGVEPPNHPGYVQFPAALLVVFALLFFRIAFDPVRHRGLIPFGCGLKVAYCGVVFWHEFTTGVPAMWLPWAWFDLVFLVVFAIAFRVVSEERVST